MTLVLTPQDMRRKNQVHRIKTEREVLALSECPFVVKLFYSFQSRAHLYLVMEFVNSGDLYSLLKNVGYLEEDTAITYVAEISVALEYLHLTLGVVHRDLCGSYGSNPVLRPTCTIRVHSPGTGNRTTCSSAQTAT